MINYSSTMSSNFLFILSTIIVYQQRTTRHNFSAGNYQIVFE